MKGGENNVYDYCKTTKLSFFVEGFLNNMGANLHKIGQTSLCSHSKGHIHIL